LRVKIYLLQILQKHFSARSTRMERTAEEHTVKREEMLQWSICALELEVVML